MNAKARAAKTLSVNVEPRVISPIFTLTVHNRCIEAVRVNLKRHKILTYSIPSHIVFLRYPVVKK